MTDDLELALLDDGPTVPEDDEGREAWRIEDDGEAAWAVRKYDAAVAERARLKANRVAEVNKITAHAERADRGPARDEAFFEAKLIDYRRRLEAATPSLRKAGPYRVATGSIRVTSGRESVNVTDKDALVDWAVDNAPEILKHEPLTSKMDGWVRKDGQIVSPDGEPVPGVAVVRGDDKYKVHPADAASEF